MNIQIIAERLRQCDEKRQALEENRGKAPLGIDVLRRLESLRANVSPIFEEYKMALRS